MRRVAVTDGMADEAVERLEQAGCEVVRQFIELQDLLDGALAEFDAVIVRSATKITKEILRPQGLNPRDYFWGDNYKQPYEDDPDYLHIGDTAGKNES